MNKQIEEIRAVNLGRVMIAARKSTNVKELREALSDATRDTTYLLDEITKNQSAVDAIICFRMALAKLDEQDEPCYPSNFV